MYSTKQLAREVVEGLKLGLSRRSCPELENIYSVCISGSCVRGDFLDCNSDLDIDVIFKPGVDFRNDPGYLLVQSIVDKIIGGRPFPSHSPGGVDWNPLLWEWLPTSETGPIAPHNGPYFPRFGIFLFDYHRHLEVCWGEDPRQILASPPDPASMVREWFETSLVKIDRLAELGDCRRMAFGTLKTVQLVQIVFGELTLDKIRLAELYTKNVPDFPMKPAGEEVVREYVGSKYPEYPPKFEEMGFYRKLVVELWDLVRGKSQIWR